MYVTETKIIRAFPAVYLKFLVWIVSHLIYYAGVIKSEDGFNDAAHSNSQIIGQG